MNKEEPHYLKFNSENEKKKYELMKIHNQINAAQKATSNQMTNSAQVLNLVSNKTGQSNVTNDSSGFTNALLVTLITGFVGGIIATVLFIFLNR